MEDDGNSISYKVLRRGTPVRSAEVSSRLAGRFRRTRIARRAKRLGKRARDAWDRR